MINVDKFLATFVSKGKTVRITDDPKLNAKCAEYDCMETDVNIAIWYDNLTREVHHISIFCGKKEPVSYYTHGCFTKMKEIYGSTNRAYDTLLKTYDDMGYPYACQIESLETMLEIVRRILSGKSYKKLLDKAIRYDGFEFSVPVELEEDVIKAYEQLAKERNVDVNDVMTEAIDSFCKKIVGDHQVTDSVEAVLEKIQREVWDMYYLSEYCDNQDEIVNLMLGTATKIDCLIKRR